MNKREYGVKEVTLWEMLTEEIRSTGNYLEDGDFESDEELRTYEAYMNMLKAVRAQMHLIYDL